MHCWQNFTKLLAIHSLRKCVHVPSILDGRANFDLSLAEVLSNKQEQTKKTRGRAITRTTKHRRARARAITSKNKHGQPGNNMQEQTGKLKPTQTLNRSKPENLKALTETVRTPVCLLPTRPLQGRISCTKQERPYARTLYALAISHVYKVQLQTRGRETYGANHGEQWRQVVSATPQTMTDSSRDDQGSKEPWWYRDLQRLVELWRILLLVSRIFAIGVARICVGIHFVSVLRLFRTSIVFVQA